MWNYWERWQGGKEGERRRGYGEGRRGYLGRGRRGEGEEGMRGYAHEGREGRRGGKVGMRG
jgi:hypothetical protein